MVTSAGVSCWPSLRMVPSLTLMAHSTTKVSSGSTLAMNASFPDSAYLIFPALLMRFDMITPGCSSLGWTLAAYCNPKASSLQLPSPGHQKLLDLADHEGQDQRQRNGRHQRGEDFWNHIKRASLEDGM